MTIQKKGRVNKMTEFVVVASSYGSTTSEATQTQTATQKTVSTSTDDLPPQECNTHTVEAAVRKAIREMESDLRELEEKVDVAEQKPKQQPNDATAAECSICCASLARLCGLLCNRPATELSSSSRGSV